MYPLTNLSKTHDQTYRAQSETDPSRHYTIRLTDLGSQCSCPAGQHGRSCKHVRALRFVLIVRALLSNNKPQHGEHCDDMDGWCRYPRRWLWEAVRELAWRDGEADLSAGALQGIRAMYLCDGCRHWGESLLRRVAQIGKELGIKQAA